MATKKTVDFELRTKGTQKAAAEFKKVEEATDKVAQKAKKAGTNFEFMRVKTAGVRRRLGELRNVLLVVTFAFAGLIRAIHKSVEAYKRQWEAEQQLISAMKNVKSNIDANSQSLIGYAAQLQKTTIYSDENIISGMAMLSTFQLNAEAIQAITPRLLDMASAAKQAGMEENDLKSVAIALGKGLTGQVGMLSRYGVVIDKAGLAMARAKGPTAEFNFILGELDKNFKGIAKALAESDFGKLNLMTKELTDIKEKVGVLGLPLEMAFYKTQLRIIETITFFIEFRKEIGLLKDELYEANEDVRRWYHWIGALAKATTGDATMLMLMLKQKTEEYEEAAINAATNVRKALTVTPIDIGGLHRPEGVDEIVEAAEEYLSVIKPMQEETGALIQYMDSLGQSMAQAAVYGQKMGQAIVSALKAIVAEILAEIAIYIVANALGIPIGSFSKGSGLRSIIDNSKGFAGTGGMFDGGISYKQSSGTTTNINITNLVGTDEAAVRDQLIPLINQAMANA